jgi:transcriptional regulator with XRE-family HTH domain
MFDKYLRIYREAAGLSKAELARKIGVTIGYVINMEGGKVRPPTQDTCKKIIKVLGLGQREADILLTESVKGRIPPEDFIVLLKYIHDQEDAAKRPK